MFDWLKRLRKPGPVRPTEADGAPPPGWPPSLSREDAEQAYRDWCFALWCPGEGPGLSVLRRVGFPDDALRSAFVGATPPVRVPDGFDAELGLPTFALDWWAVVPWLDRGRLARLEIHRHRLTKHDPVFRAERFVPFDDGATVFPSMEAIRDDAPLIVVGSALEAVMLGRVAGDLANVVAVSRAVDPLGRDHHSLFGRVGRCPTWFAAHPPGDPAADRWLSARFWAVAPVARVVPPSGDDWLSSVRAIGADGVRRFWLDAIRSEDRATIPARPTPREMEEGR